MKVENIKPSIGSVVATDRKSLLTDQGARQCLDFSRPAKCGSSPAEGDRVSPA